ncbi:MAG: hypothetical protein ACFFEF_04375 [Candidatus Thorarchaeota archaeon]
MTLSKPDDQPEGFLLLLILGVSFILIIAALSLVYMLAALG